MILDLLDRRQQEFCADISFDDMNVDRFMVVRIEQKSESEKNKNCRHRLFCFLVTNIGNNFITCKYFAEKTKNAPKKSGRTVV